MKREFFWSLFLVCSLRLEGQIFADFRTSLGDFSTELDYENSPIAVANFMTLAEGSRPWLDLANGLVRSQTPFYDGLIFHRVVSGFVNQAGSRNGLGTDNPGYNFVDEVDNGLSFDSPYLLAMANSGVNTNGSQFFITVGTPTPLNGVHTIFGSVSTGREVIDAINNVAVSPSERPLVDVVIQSVTIRRVGVAANAFDEFEQFLPVTSPLDIEVQLVASSPFVFFDQPVGTTLTMYLSPDLTTWRVFRQLVAPSQLPFIGLDLSSVQTVLDRHFYSTSLVTWPQGAFLPSSLSNHTLSVTSDSLSMAGPAVFTFDDTGQSGVCSLSLPSGMMTGTFSLLEAVGNEVYRGALTLGVTGLALEGGESLVIWLFENLRLENATTTTIKGRFNGAVFNEMGEGVIPLQGSHTIERP